VQGSAPDSPVDVGIGDEGRTFVNEVRLAGAPRIEPSVHALPERAAPDRGRRRRREAGPSAGSRAARI